MTTNMATPRIRPRRLRTGRATLAIVMASTAPMLGAVELPPLNLGDSSFQDGIAGPGRLVQATLSSYHSHRARDERGNPVDTPTEVGSTALLMQLSYLSERKLFGAYVGAEAILPLASVRVSPSDGARLEETAEGDLFLSPILLQWPERTLFGRPFWQRVNLNVTLPTGSYVRNAPINIGSNAWRMNPHYAFTWVASPAWEFSGRLHYLWVAPNREPPAVTGARDMQAGTAFHANASVSRAVGDRLRLGASSYYLRQLTDDRVDGLRVTGRERALGIGPAMSWRSGSATIHAAAYWESRVEDRNEGLRLSVRYAVVF